MVVGDSISEGCDSVPLYGWCSELSALLTARGITHTIAGRVVVGASCVTLEPGFASRFDQIQPDLVIMNCGTNDSTGTQAQLDWLGNRWRTMVEYSHTHGAMVLPVFIQYSNPEINDENNRGYLVNSEGAVNDVVYIQIQYYQAYGWFAGLADLQRIPGDWNYLNGGTDGIHPNSFGKKIYAIVFYRALQEFYGWSATVGEPCGMWAHRRIYNPPTFTDCVSMT